MSKLTCLFCPESLSFMLIKATTVSARASSELDWRERRAQSQEGYHSHPAPPPPLYSALLRPLASVCCLDIHLIAVGFFIVHIAFNSNFSNVCVYGKHLPHSIWRVRAK